MNKNLKLKDKFNFIYEYFERYKKTDQDITFNVYLKQNSKDEKEYEAKYYIYRQVCWFTSDAERFDQYVEHAINSAGIATNIYAEKHNIVPTSLGLARKFVIFIYKHWDEIYKKGRQDVINPLIFKFIPQILSIKNLDKKLKLPAGTAKKPLNTTFEKITVHKECEEQTQNLISQPEVQQDIEDVKDIENNDSSPKEFDYIENNSMKIKSPLGLSITIPSSYPDEQYSKLMTYLRSL